MHNGRPPRLRRLNQQIQQQYLYKATNGIELVDRFPSSLDMAESSSSLRRHVAASPMQHHRSFERNNQAMRSIYSASNDSSMEVAPHEAAVSSTSSFELSGRNGDTNCSLRTSAELLQVLNRIWSLEEQHASNTSLVKSLKDELDHAHSRIKELVQEKQADRQEMNQMLKHFTENREQHNVNAAIQSIRHELEDERKLRKRSESLHRKLGKELSDAKLNLASLCKELEKERESHNLLEDLCDEFALKIRDCETEFHALRKASNRKVAERNNQDRLVLHVSESWIDERKQMRKKSENCVGEKKPVVEKLRSEIETFLQVKSNDNSNDPVKMDVSAKLKTCDVGEKIGNEERENAKMRNHTTLMLQSENKRLDKDHGSPSSNLRSHHPSPLSHWSDHKSPFNHNLVMSEPWSKSTPGLKENTLKAKLLVAKSKGQRQFSRLKASIIPSRKE